MKNCIGWLLAIALIACSSDNEPESTLLTGEWLLVESGWSPGSGYFITPIASEPRQAIRFNDDGSLESTMDNFDYKFFELDSARSAVRFFYSRPVKPDTTNRLNSYLYQLTDDSLKLYYMGCIEGCHMGFIRMSTSNN